MKGKILIFLMLFLSTAFSLYLQDNKVYIFSLNSFSAPIDINNPPILNYSECLFVFANDTDMNTALPLILAKITPTTTIFKSCSLAIPPPILPPYTTINLVGGNSYTNNTGFVGIVSCTNNTYPPCPACQVCTNTTINNTSYLKSNVISPLLSLGENWTEPNSNVTCRARAKYSETLTLAYGNTMNNIYDTGINVISPPICPVCTVCQTCQVCQTCPTEKICPIGNGFVNLTKENPFYINPELNVSVKCNYPEDKSFWSFFAANGSCNETVTLSGTNLTYCPGRMLPDLCSPEEKKLNNLETCVNNIAGNATQRKEECVAQKAKVDNDLLQCTTGQNLTKENQENFYNLLALIAIVFVIGMAAVFYLKNRKEAE